MMGCSSDLVREALAGVVAVAPLVTGSPCQIRTTPATARLADHVVGPHHLVLFVLHDVAVEDVAESAAVI